MAITRLIGGLTPANGADPKTLPAIWNDTADQIEQYFANLVATNSRLDGYSLDDLGNVTITGPGAGQVLTFINGGQWANTTPAIYNTVTFFWNFTNTGPLDPEFSNTANWYRPENLISYPIRMTYCGRTVAGSTPTGFKSDIISALSSFYAYGLDADNNQLWYESAIYSRAGSSYPGNWGNNPPNPAPNGQHMRTPFVKPRDGGVQVENSSSATSKGGDGWWTSIYSGYAYSQETGFLRYITEPNFDRVAFPSLTITNPEAYTLLNPFNHIVIFEYNTN